MIDLDKVKVTVLTHDQVFYWDEELGEHIENFPSRYYALTSLGYEFYHVRSRDTAQRSCNHRHGVGKYIVRSAKITGSSGDSEYTAVGVSTRKCFSPRLKGLRG